MAEASVAVPSRNGSDAQRQELARTLATKLRQGFAIESEDETEAVLVMKGRRRWFGLSNNASARFHVSVDGRGRASSRRL